MNELPPQQIAEIRLEQKRKEVQASNMVAVLYGWSGITAVFLLGSIVFAMTGSRGFGFAAIMAIIAYGTAYIAQSMSSYVCMATTPGVAREYRAVYDIFQKISFGSATLGGVFLIVGVRLR